MPGLELHISALGEDLVRRDLLRFEANLVAPVAALEIAATALRDATQKQFDTEGGYGSGGWEAIAATTVTQKARLGLNPKILQATDRLMTSLIEKFSPDHIERLSTDSLTFGSMVDYGLYHATGTRKMPKRSPVAISDADKVKLVKEMQLALLGQRGRL